MPNHTLELHHLGPIDECRLTVTPFTVLTGPQSNGKSTVAKAIFFFRTVKQDILSIMMQGGPKAITGNAGATWEHILKQRMRDKFLQLFGTSWIMSDRMEMKYSYTSQYWIHVFLKGNWDDPGKNFVDFEFSRELEDYFGDLENHSFSNISVAQKKWEEEVLSKKLADPYETVFIPAGRNLITLLSTQLNYIFTSLETPQLRNIDYVTRRYTELILKLKPSFKAGMIGLLTDLENDPEQMRNYKKNRNAVHLLLEAAEDVLRGTYRCVDGEERLYLDERRYIKINYTSSGQQEIVWVFNLLFYYLLENRKIFLILEEPESHLYPDSQQIVGQILALFHNSKNAVLTTTHSPYILGTFNYMLLAGQVPTGQGDALSKLLPDLYWLNPSKVSAYHVHGGKMDNALGHGDGLTLIDNSLIDGASQDINGKVDDILGLLDIGE